MREKVFGVMDDALKAGLPLPSIRNVRAAIGGGSLTDIMKFVQEWKSLHPAVSKVKEKIGFTDEEQSRILGCLWDVLNPVIQQQTEARISELKEFMEESRKYLEAQKSDILFETMEIERQKAESECLVADAEMKAANAEKRAVTAEETVSELQQSLESVKQEKDLIVKDFQRKLEEKVKAELDFQKQLKQLEDERLALNERLQEQKELISMLRLQLHNEQKKA